MSFINADDRLIYLKDEKSKYIFVNTAFEDFCQKSLCEITGPNGSDLADNELADIWGKRDLDVLRDKTPFVGETEWRNRVYRENRFPVELPNGYYGVGAYIEDITEISNSKQEQEKTLLRNSLLVDILTKTFDSTQEQLDYVLNESLELTESKFGYIYLYDEKTEVFTLNSWSKDVMDECMIMKKQTKYQLEKTGIWGEAVRQRKPIIDNDFRKPNALKKGYPEGHVILAKYMTIPVVIDGEIVAVVGLANKEDDYDDNDIYQVTALMTGVWNAKERREREIELEKANIELKENKDKLQLLLDSTAEAVYGIDNNGNCTFCNAGFLKMMGYNHQGELIGKNMHFQIHHSHKDGTPMPTNECRIFQAFIAGEGTYVDDEVLWRRDGTCFEAQYSSYPQYRDGKIIGAVVTFTDITERKKAENEIRYLSYHDPLTGLYNRMFFQEELKRIDVQRNLPISIIVGDVNGLKLTNDVFGHIAGDILLKTASAVFKRVCRGDDIIARMGGDEFIILLPKTTIKEAKGIIHRIKNEFSKENITAITGSISMGCDAKVSVDQDIVEAIKNAEDKMYLEKALNRKNVSNTFLNTITERLHAKSPREKEHSRNVSELSRKIGEALDLPDEEIRKLKEVGFLHNIGKIVLDESMLEETDPLADLETKKGKQHSVVGYRILNSFDDTVDLAEYVLAHHENWDGSGYPKGLRGEEIPKLARIIKVAGSFDLMTNRLRENAMNEEDAIKEIMKQAGTKFDPDIVRILPKIVLRGDDIL
jgi:diguanylate cyclase (GGDEF)-like protein/PAS domain S-box-containing protein